jgi:hypothetical protein
MVFNVPTDGVPLTLILLALVSYTRERVMLDDRVPPPARPGPAVIDLLVMLSNCACIGLLLPMRCDSSVVVAVVTATFPLPSDISTLLVARLLAVMVDAAPVMAECTLPVVKYWFVPSTTLEVVRLAIVLLMPAICTWRLEVLPDRCDSSVLEVVDTVTFPLASDISTLVGVVLAVRMEDAAPVMLALALPSVK